MRHFRLFKVAVIGLLSLAAVGCGSGVDIEQEMIGAWEVDMQENDNLAFGLRTAGIKGKTFDFNRDATGTETTDGKPFEFKWQIAEREKDKLKVTLDYAGGRAESINLSPEREADTIRIRYSGMTGTLRRRVQE